jgi:hypothetical protein
MRNGAIHSMPGRQEERFDTTLAVRLERGSAVTRNVSANGIYFTTDVAIEAGATVSFALDFQSFPGGPLQVNCIARVVRIEEQDGKKGVAAAIQSFEFQRIPLGRPPSFSNGTQTPWTPTKQDS